MTSEKRNVHQRARYSRGEGEPLGRAITKSERQRIDDWLRRREDRQFSAWTRRRKK